MDGILLFYGLDGCLAIEFGTDITGTSTVICYIFFLLVCVLAIFGSILAPHPITLSIWQIDKILLVGFDHMISSKNMSG